MDVDSRFKVEKFRRMRTKEDCVFPPRPPPLCPDLLRNSLWVEPTVAEPSWPIYPPNRPPHARSAIPLQCSLSPLFLCPLPSNTPPELRGALGVYWCPCANHRRAISYRVHMSANHHAKISISGFDEVDLAHRGHRSFRHRKAEGTKKVTPRSPCRAVARVSARVSAGLSPTWDKK